MENDSLASFCQVLIIFSPRNFSSRIRMKRTMHHANGYARDCRSCCLHSVYLHSRNNFTQWLTSAALRFFLPWNVQRKWKNYYRQKLINTVMWEIWTQSNARLLGLTWICLFSRTASRSIFSFLQGSPVCLKHKEKQTQTTPFPLEQ